MRKAPSWWQSVCRRLLVESAGRSRDLETHPAAGAQAAVLCNHVALASSTPHTQIFGVSAPTRNHYRFQLCKRNIAAAAQDVDSQSRPQEDPREPLPGGCLGGAEEVRPLSHSRVQSPAQRRASRRPRQEHQRPAQFLHQKSLLTAWVSLATRLSTRRSTPRTST